MTRGQWIGWGLGLVLGLGGPTLMVVQAEALVRRAEPLLLELAPVDPRSLLQGDYMRLDYGLAQELDASKTEGWPRTGELVVEVDEHGVAQAARRHEGAPLRVGERLLRYRLRNGRVYLGAESFFFQEGHAAYYEPARYGELRVDASGASILVGLRDEDRQVLGPSGDHPLQ